MERTVAFYTLGCKSKSIRNKCNGTTIYTKQL